MDTWKKFWISSCLTTFPSLAKSARKPMRSVFMLLYMEMAWTCLTLSIWERTSIPCSNCPFPLSPEPLPLFKNKVFFTFFYIFLKSGLTFFKNPPPSHIPFAPIFYYFPYPPICPSFLPIAPVFYYFPPPFTSFPCFLLFYPPLHHLPLFFTILPSSSPFAPVFFTISHCFLLFATFFTTWPCFPPEMRFKNINYLINMHHNLELTSSVRQLLTYSETH